MRPLGRRHVGPVGRRQDVAAGHVQDVRGREFEVDRGAVGVVDDGRQEGVLGCRGGGNRNVSEKSDHRLLIAQSTSTQFQSRPLKIFNCADTLIDKSIRL